MSQTQSEQQRINVLLVWLSMNSARHDVSSCTLNTGQTVLPWANAGQLHFVIVPLCTSSLLYTLKTYTVNRGCLHSETSHITLLYSNLLGHAIWIPMPGDQSFNYATNIDSSLHPFYGTLCILSMQVSCFFSLCYCIQPALLPYICSLLMLAVCVDW